jgi:cell division initiation protein
MSLTPLDIHNKEFARSFRGYREEEVDDFLDLVVREFETILRDNQALRDRVQQCEKELRHYRNLEETLNRTLVVAQEAAREIKANADKEAQLTIRQAEQQATRVIDEAQARMGRAYAEYDELRRRTHVFRVRMRNFLEGQLELFQDSPQDAWDADKQGTPATHVPPVHPLPDADAERLRPTPPVELAREAVAASEEDLFEPLTRPGETHAPGDHRSDSARGRRHWVDDLLDDKEDSR